MANMDIANPSEEHLMLREMVREWTKEYVEPQALEYDRDEKFNLELLRSMGELGLLGISAPEEYGGAALDAVAGDADSERHPGHAQFILLRTRPGVVHPSQCDGLH